MNRRTLALTLILIIVAALGHWVSRESDIERKILPREPRHVADYFISGFSATTMGPDGMPTHRLEAETASHFADDDTTDLTRPHLTVFGIDFKEWHIFADTGRISADGDDVYLSGDVRIEQTDSRTSEVAIRMMTDNMHVQISAKFAETDAPLKVTGPGSEIDAVGMRAYVEEQRLVLLSNVRGTYAPPQP